jgi:4-hydroxybenzoyl-CoA reductase subunit beta
MMTLPPLEILHPDSVADAVTMLRDRPGAKLLAGGTDIVPNLKYGMYETTALVALRGLSRELRYIREEDGELRLGALCTIDQVARDEKVLTRFPALAEAAAAIAGPQLRRMGTLGGNLCLDTRCVYINQSHFWRKALGYCLKKDGTVCHVVKGGQRCVAAASNDTAPILMALGASVRLASPRGERTLSLEDLYVADGIKNTRIEPDEILVEAKLPLINAQLKQAYGKLRTRAAIDFPALNFGVAIGVDAEKKISSLRLCVSALAARPAMVRHVEELKGRSVATAEEIKAVGAELGKRAQKQCKPLTNIGIDPEWRRDIMPVLIRRAVQKALAD